jgi:hypothetical protein
MLLSEILILSDINSKYLLTANPFPAMTRGSILYREIPVMNTRSLQWEKGFPVMKTGFSL